MKALEIVLVVGFSLGLMAAYYVVFGPIAPPF